MKKIIATVFLDTCVIKAAKDSEVIFLPTEKIIDWGHTKSSIVTHKMVYKNQNAQIKEENPQAFSNRIANRLISQIAKKKHIRLLITQEVLFEAMKIPSVDFCFYRSPIEIIKTPFQHHGILINVSKHNYLYDALSSINNHRFFELQKLTGAYQGKSKPLNKNQLFDAFHLWCAESAEAEFFLTHDEKLIKMWEKSKFKGSCRPIDSTALLVILLQRNLALLIVVIKEVLRIRKSRRNLSEEFQTYEEVDEKFTREKSN